MTMEVESDDALLVALQAVAEIERRGWHVRDHGTVLEIRSPPTPEFDVLIRQAKPLLPFAEVHLEAELNGVGIVAHVSRDGGVALSDEMPGTILEGLRGAERSALRAAWAGDSDHIAGLAVENWVLRATADLRERRGDVQFLVFREVEQFEQLLLEIPFWRWGELFQVGHTTVVLLANVGDHEFLHSPSISVGGAGPSVLESRHALSPMRRLAFRGDGPLLELPSAEDIYPQSGTGLPRVAALFRQAAACLAWLAFGSSAAVNASAITVEILGLRRTYFELSQSNVPDQSEACAATLALYRWANAGSSVDHLIATRQVLSLFEDPPWGKADEVQQAAEPIFVALRSDALADVLKTRRELHGLVSKVAMQTAEASIGAVRATAERVVTLLIGVAGVFVAYSLDVITAELANTLRDLLAAGLGVLALWNVFVEGPLLGAPLRSFRRDLPQTSWPLSEREREQIENLDAVVSARRRVVTLRFLLPAVLVVAAAIAWLT